MLLDTPGHVDFSAEMERTLQVLDYAILVISGKDGVQGHTATLWKLLRKYNVPVFIFVNKMDLSGTDKNEIIANLKKNLDDCCIDFTSERNEEWFEQIAMCDEGMMEEFLESGYISTSNIAGNISSRNLFPCYFGSALKIDGVEEFLDNMDELIIEHPYSQEFGARVFKITRDNQGNRLTHMKITGGSLRTKDQLNEEKVEQIRVYSGSKFKTADYAESGDICAVTGLKNTFAGQGLGAEMQAVEPMLESVLVYQVILPPELDVHVAFTKLKQLEEEDPQLKVIWNEQLQEIQMQLMGEVQIEILKNVIKERFDYNIDFGQGNITYKETIAAPVAGAGHF
jgi:translation elongation factor EF-G